jgi:hypothetical protein
MKINVHFKFILVILLLIILLPFNSKTVYAQQSTVRMDVGSNNGSTDWGVSVTYNSTVGTPSTLGPYTVYTSTVPAYSTGKCVGYNADGNIAIYLANGLGSSDSIHWFTACVDPTSPISISSVGGTDSNSIYTLNCLNVTCIQGGSPSNYYIACNGQQNNLSGQIGPNAQCPNACFCTAGGVVNNTINCCNAGGTCSGTTCVVAVPIPSPPTGLNAAPYCNSTASRMTFSWNAVSGATYYNLTWNNDAPPYTATSYNNLTVTSFSPDIAYNQGTLINWSIAACNSSGCSTPATGAKTSSVCTGGTTCDFTTPERRMIDSCTYQVCQSPSPGSWGPNQSCSPNQTLTAVLNGSKYSCTRSTGSCMGTITCQQCSGSPSTCTSYPYSGGSICPTDCGGVSLGQACGGSSACF